MAMIPTRVEEVRFLVKLTEEGVSKHRKHVRAIVPIPPLGSEDSLYVSYKLYIQYFGDVAAKLNALKTLLADPENVVEVSLDEVLQGQCLINEVLVSLKECQDIIASR